MVFLHHFLFHLFADTHFLISLKRASQTKAGSDGSVFIARFPCGSQPAGIQTSSSSRPSSCACLVAYAQFGEDVADMAFDRIDGNDEFLGNLPVGNALC